MELCRQVRPNGKEYKARKPPVAVLYEGDWPEDASVMVLRCGKEDREEARELAVALAAKEGCDLVNSGNFGWWREVIRDGDYMYEYDSAAGAPGWYFNIG